MVTRAFLSVLVFGVAATFAVAGQNSEAKLTSWSGTIVYSSCDADEAFAESPECFKSAPGAQFSLYDDTNRVMYSLQPQGPVSGHLGDSVTIHGTLDETTATIHVASIKLMSIGLAVGQKAPAFSLRDQYGQTQTLETLKGPKGTVLLFFRSADW